MRCGAVVVALLAGLCAAAPRARASDESSWPRTLTPHFELRHESVWLPPGFVISLESIHSRLSLDLAMFSPWMAQERIKLYLYATPQSYAAGRFQPPSWSNGLALYQAKTVIVYNEPSRRKLDSVLAHETTHLLFESYWGEAGKRPPAWLNEGLAMLEEADSPEHPESSDWYQMMLQLPQQRLYGLSSLFKITPTEDLSDGGKVTTWYAESYSVVYFLFREHSKLQFHTFVSDLREGKTLEQALWLVYRYHSLADFQKAWLAWLRRSTHARRPVLMGVSEESASPDAAGSEGQMKPIGQIDGFKPLKGGR